MYVHLVDAILLRQEAEPVVIGRGNVGVHSEGQNLVVGFIGART